MRQLIKGQIKYAYKNYLNDIQLKLKSDPKKFWSLHATNGTSRIPVEMRYNGLVLNTGQSIVGSFADFFKSVYTLDDGSMNVNSSTSNNDCNIGSTTTFLNGRYIKLQKKLTDKMTAGPDGIPSLIVKDCICVFYDTLLIIYSVSQN